MQKIYVVWDCIEHIDSDSFANQFENFVDKIFTSKAKAIEYMSKTTKGVEPTEYGNYFYESEDNLPSDKSYLRVEEFEIEEEA